MQTTVIKRKKLSGMVVSNKMKDTAVVVVERFIKHPKYQKYMQIRKRYMAHDEGNKAQIGDKVVIEETRPMSRHKTFKILEISEVAKK
jgi:small subunit ribosomal protein S17